MTTEVSSPQRLYLIQVADVPAMNMPLVCYLVQTGDNRNILIDSGVIPNMQLPPGMESFTSLGNVVEQLAKIGLQPADIDMLICTHFHPDHCGYNEIFTNAQYVVQRSHYAHVQQAPQFAFSRPHWDLPAERYRFVEGDTEMLPGLKLLETSGHTRGHQSVLVHLPESGDVLLAIDAVTSQDRFIPDVQKSPRDEDEVALRIGTQKLLDLAKNVSLVVFGHDGTQWKTLRKLPEPYC